MARDLVGRGQRLGVKELEQLVEPPKLAREVRCEVWNETTLMYVVIPIVPVFENGRCFLSNPLQIEA